MGYPDAATTSILAEIGLLEINHRILDAGGPFGATLQSLAARFPQYAEFIYAFDTRWVEMLGGPIDASIEIMQKLKRAGVPVHAISNYSREKFDIARTLYPFLNDFDELVLSGDVGIVKPDRESSTCSFAGAIWTSAERSSSTTRLKTSLVPANLGLPPSTSRRTRPTFAPSFSD
jgi:hypothetical protein